MASEHRLSITAAQIDERLAMVVKNKEDIELLKSSTGAVIDSNLSLTSINPVQNKVVATKIKELEEELGITSETEDDTDNEASTPNVSDETLDYTDDMIVGYHTMTSSSTNFQSNDAGFNIRTVNFDVQAGEKYTLTGTIFAAVCLYVMKDAAGNSIDWFPKTEQSSTMVEQTKTVEIPAGVTTLGFSFINTYSNSVVKLGGGSGNSTPNEKNESTIKTLKECVKIIEDQMDSVLQYYMNKVLCIGDSLTAGYYHNGAGYVVATENYPFYLKRMLNAEIVDNISESGITTSGWYTRYANDMDATKYDTALIWLGTNDGLTDTLESDTSGGNYNNYAGTNTGCYCKIVEKMIEQNPNIRIFLGYVFIVGGADGAQKALTTNNVIKQIAEKYSDNVVGVVNNHDGTLYGGENQGLYHPFAGINGDMIHFGRVGNLHLAQHWVNKICDLISNNESMLEVLVE